MVEALPVRDTRPCLTSDLSSIGSTLEACERAGTAGLFERRLDWRDNPLPGEGTLWSESGRVLRLVGGLDRDVIGTVSVECRVRIEGEAEGAGELTAVETTEIGWTTVPIGWVSPGLGSCDDDVREDEESETEESIVRTDAARLVRGMAPGVSE